VALSSDLSRIVAPTIRASPTRRWRGVNAVVVGLLLAALYSPVWTAGISNGTDFVIAAATFLLLFMWQTPPWLVVVLCAAAAGGVGYLT